MKINELAHDDDEKYLVDGRDVDGNAVVQRGRDVADAHGERQRRDGTDDEQHDFIKYFHILSPIFLLTLILL